MSVCIKRRDQTFIEPLKVIVYEPLIAKTDIQLCTFGIITVNTAIFDYNKYLIMNLMNELIPESKHISKYLCICDCLSKASIGCTSSVGHFMNYKISYE